MSVPMKDIEIRVRRRLEVERTERGDVVRGLLAAASRIGDWARSSVPEDLREYLRAREAEAAVELLRALVEWERLGGTVELTLPRPDDADGADGAASPFSLEFDVERTGRALREPEAVAAETPPVEARSAAEPRPAAEVTHAAPRASDETLSRLVAHFRTGGPEGEQPPPVDWRVPLSGVLAALGEPGDDDERELERLHRAVREAEQWRALPREVQRDMVGFVTTRLRRLQDERGFDGPRLDEAFSLLSAWSRRAQPGYVNGLSRAHRPTRSSWSADADAYADRLQAPLAGTTRPNGEKLLAAVELVVPEVDQAPSPEAREAVLAQARRVVREALEGGVSPRDPRLVRLVAPVAVALEGPEFRALRRAVREDAEADAPDEGETRPDPIPPEWPWWARTDGRRAVMIGGDPREPNRQRLEQTFRFAELTWEPSEFRRNSLQSVRDRVRAGKVDLVIILGAFVGHDADEVILPACREQGIDWVHLDKGYGVVRLRRAIERFLDP